MKHIILATIGFFIGTIAVSFIWYGLFSSQYEASGLAELGFEEPSNYIIWFVNILIIGAALSYLYDYLSSTKKVPVVMYVSMAGILSWAWSVLSVLAWMWQEIDAVAWFALLQTGLFIFQFTVYGLVLRWVYRHHPKSA